MDAAFGPMPGMGGELAPLAAVPPDPLVQEAQQLLKRLGYDPGPADGQMTPRTRSAMEALAMAAKLDLVALTGTKKWTFTPPLVEVLKKLVERAEAQKPQGEASSLVDAHPKKRFYESPLFAVAAVVGSIGLYLYLRKEPESAPEAVAGVDTKPKRRKREPSLSARTLSDYEPTGESVIEGAVMKKCDRTPTFDAGGEAVTAENIDGPMLSLPDSSATVQSV